MKQLDIEHINSEQLSIELIDMQYWITILYDNVIYYYMDIGVLRISRGFTEMSIVNSDSASGELGTIGNPMKQVVEDIMYKTSLDVITKEDIEKDISFGFISLDDCMEEFYKLLKETYYEK